MKKIYTLFLLIYVSPIFAQTINNNFPGQNAWMPATLPNCTAPSGSFTNHWTDIQNSGVEFLRIGGNDYDKCLRVANDYTALFTGSNSFPNIISMGFIPVVQLSYYQTGTAVYTNPNTAAANAKLIVDALYPLGVRYFSIGNEPDLNPDYAVNNNFVPPHAQNTAAGIYDYISTISTLIRASYNTGNGNPVFLVGPEVSSYTQSTITALTSGTYNVLPYIDIFSFHTYPFGDEGTTASGYQIDPTRANIINVLRNVNPVYFANSSQVTPLESQLTSLNTTIASYNSANSTSIKVAITEANICYENDNTGTNSTVGTDDLITGNGANGLLAGQFWAEMMAVCMNKSVEFINFWSVKEGGSTLPSNIEYLDGTTGNKKPLYHHFEMVADNFKGTYYNQLYTSNDDTHKAFAYLNTAPTPDEIGVLIINQDLQSPSGDDLTTKSFKINFNTNAISGSEDMLFDFNMGSSVPSDYPCSLVGESSMLLVFPINSNIPTRRYVYGLSQALNGEAPLDVSNTTKYIYSQNDFTTYVPTIYNIIEFIPNSLHIVEGSSDSKIFRFMTSATINPTPNSPGYLEIPLGAEFTLMPTPACY